MHDFRPFFRNVHAAQLRWLGPMQWILNKCLVKIMCKYFAKDKGYAFKSSNIFLD